MTKVKRNRGISLFLCAVMLFAVLANAAFLAGASVTGGYAVVYDPNGATGGAVPTDSGTYEQGTLVQVQDNIGNLEKTGCRFGGWRIDAVAYQPGDTISMPKGGVTLCAVWIPLYSVVYSGGTAAHTGEPPVDSVQYPEGADVTVLGNSGSLDAGYGFQRWNTDLNGSGVGYDPGSVLHMSAGGVTLYPIYKNAPDMRMYFSVAYSANGASSGFAPASVLTLTNSPSCTVAGNTGSLLKTGYAFGGWNTAADGSGTTYQSGNTITVESDMTLYAMWQPVYTITYEPNGGSLLSGGSSGGGSGGVGGVGGTGGVPVTNVTAAYAKGTKVRLPDYAQMISPPDYKIFNGWNTMANGTGSFYMPGDVITIVSNLTLYPVWAVSSPYPYSTIYNGSGNDGGALPAMGRYASGQTITLPGQGTLSKEGCLFAGWQDSAGSLYPSGQVFTVTGNLTLYARWVPVCKVTYNTQGTSLSAPAAAAYPPGAKVTVLGTYGAFATQWVSGMSLYCYLSGWNTAADGSGAAYQPGDTFFISGNTTLYAIYSYTPLTPLTSFTSGRVTYSNYGADSGAAPTDAVLYVAGETVTVKSGGSLSKSGYNFTGWSTRPNGGGTVYSSTFAYPANRESVVLFPVFVWGGGGGQGARVGSILYNSNGAVGGTVPEDSVICYPGEQATVLGNTGGLFRGGYYFAGWNTAANGSGTTYHAGNKVTLAIDSEGRSVPIELYAMWTAGTITHTVSYAVKSSYAYTGSLPAGTAYGEGTMVTAPECTAVVAGYYFGGWSTEPYGGVAYVPGDRFMMKTGNVTLYAVYFSNPVYRVFYNANHSTGGYANNVGTSYNVGSTVTAIYPGTMTGPSDCYFAGWSTTADGSGTTYQAGDTFTMGSSNITLYAKWSLYPEFLIVTYNGCGNDGGTVPTDFKGYQAGNTAQLAVVNLWNSGASAKISKTGYVFCGWWAQGAFYQPGASMTISGNVTAYAIWSTLKSDEPLCRVAYSGNGNTSGIAPAAADYSTSSTVTLSGNTGGLSRTGFRFSGWSDGTTVYQPGDEYHIQDRLSTLLLNAVWKPVYSITYEGNGSTGGTVPIDSIGYANGETVTLADNDGNMSRENSMFVGWCVNGHIYYPGNTLTVAGSNLTATAVWVDISVPYADENGSIRSVAAKKITAATTELADGWYIISGDVTINETVFVTGNVSLILADGCTLIVNGTVNLGIAGINVPAGSSLTIYGQAGGTGVLNATGHVGAGIGGNYSESSGSIIINGGIVNATGGTESAEGGAGIGGGYSGNNGSIVINGGIINATGGIEGGAGIGGGASGNGGTVTIKSGTVNATGSYGGAGIGGGDYGNGGTITIKSGTVNAAGSYGGAGIGDGYQGTSSVVAISGGTVYATGSGFGTAIRGTLTITGGSVNADDVSAPTNGSARVYLTTIALENVNSAASIEALTIGAVYSYGTTGMYTDTAGRLYLWLPEGATVTEAMTASGKGYAGSVQALNDNSAIGTLTLQAVCLHLTKKDSETFLAEVSVGVPSAKKVKLIFAQYNGKKLLNMQFAEVDLGIAGKQSFTFTLPSSPDGGEVSVFLWKGTDSLMPICPPARLGIQ